MLCDMCDITLHFSSKSKTKKTKTKNKIKENK